MLGSSNYLFYLFRSICLSSEGNYHGTSIAWLQMIRVCQTSDFFWIPFIPLIFLVVSATAGNAANRGFVNVIKYFHFQRRTNRKVYYSVCEQSCLMSSVGLEGFFPQNIHDDVIAMSSGLFWLWLGLRESLHHKLKMWV